MNKIAINAALFMSFMGIIACGQPTEKHQNNYNQADGKTDIKDQATEDSSTEEDNWCDSNYRQHCENNYVTWCNPNEGTVSRLNCAEYPGRSCQEAVDGNLADCVAFCSANGAEEKACSATGSTDSSTVAILATAKCLPTTSGNLALFTINRESCSSCADLTCYIEDVDRGGELNVGEVCVKGTFQERCQDNKALYCAEVDESTIVQEQPCVEKSCIIDADSNYATCATAEDEGCEVGKVTYRCGTGLFEFYSFRYKCIKDKNSDKTYNVSVYSEPCANGLNKATCECEADDGWR